MQLQRGQVVSRFRGFLHHTGSKNWHNMEKVYSPLGQIPRGQYAFVVPADLDVAVGDTLLWNGRSFAVRRVENVLYRNKSLYRWGLCVERGGSDTWPM